VAVRQRPSRGAPGQHFLRSSRLAAELVLDAGIAPGDLVVDAGAGTGVLTRALAGAGARVVALELDPALAATLRGRFGADVAVLELDAREFAWPQEPFSVVANLPFAGSLAILSRMLDPAGGLRSADAIVQWELAHKQCAVWPSTARSTCWRAWFELAISRRLSRAAFAPPPSVDAAVLRVTRRERPLVRVADHRAYRRFLEDGFGSREPVARGLRRWLTPRQVRKTAAVAGFDPHARAWDLDARQWAKLFALL
jgi:23S rRNA (adenine-N6)-dimethyltransferase